MTAETIKDKWYKKIDQAINVLYKEKIKLDDKMATANAILPFWQKFIILDSDIPEIDKKIFQGKKNAEEKYKFIADHYPHYQFLAFWLITVHKIFKEQIQKQK